MDYTTMTLLYDIGKERSEKILQEQVCWQLSSGAPWGVSIMRRCAHLLIHAGLGLQRYGQWIERRTRLPYRPFTLSPAPKGRCPLDAAARPMTASLYELQISR